MANGRSGSFHLFQFAGIDVFLHWSWFLVAAFEINGRSSSRYPSLLWNIVEYLALFSIVLIHEFGHALACRQTGGVANRIVLWPLGGVAFVDPPPRPGATLWSIAAGPLVNVVLVPILWTLLHLSRSSGWAVAEPSAFALLRAIFFINFALLIFNLLPIYPLDGGQILRALLWFVLGRSRSLMVATVIGFFGAAGLILFAIRMQSLWIGVISAFMLLNCWAGLQHAFVLSRTEKAANGAAQVSGQTSRTVYAEIHDPEQQARVRSRYQEEMSSLQTLGFQPLAFCREALRPFSAILQFPLVLLLRRHREVLAFPKPFRLAVAYPLFLHSNPRAFAICMGRGVKFYTTFLDGSLLISRTFESHVVPGPYSSIVVNPARPTAAEAWLLHTRRISEMEAAGKTVSSSSSFADYVSISRREENLG